MQDPDCYLSFVGSHGLNEELGRHRCREGNKECELCGRSFMNVWNRSWPKMLPRGTTERTGTRLTGTLILTGLSLRYRLSSISIDCCSYIILYQSSITARYEQQCQKLS